ncbi:MAG: ABC-F family ATP-binding cassette domain-containing protein [Selenomonadaceae bacterium]|nr:ABC-F family ATP-binding cassette domain-containing protein [Selenomonadaceae bacterium]
MIAIKNLDLKLGRREIFSGFNLEIGRGEKVGIIGGEGVGKSTLLDILAGKIVQTAGEVKISGEVHSVDGSVYADFSELRMAEMSAIEKLKRVLNELKDDEIILLLDEPTKNLESDGVEWLINFLCERENLTTIIVSSDRYFLKETCGRTIHLGDEKVEPLKINCAELLPLTPSGAVPVVLEANSLLKNRDGEPIFKDVGFTIRQGQKVAFVGKNEQGKSKLLKSLAMAYQNNDETGGCLRGKIKFSDGVKVFSMPRVYTGAAAKGEFEKLAFGAANFLLLDNPTACLDLPTIEALEKSLVEFPGTIIFVDEDREFIRAIANRIMDITPQGTVDRIASYDDFLANETVKLQIKEKYKV